MERAGRFPKVTVEGMGQRGAKGLRLSPSKVNLERGPQRWGGADIVPGPRGQSLTLQRPRPRPSGRKGLVSPVLLKTGGLRTLVLECGSPIPINAMAGDGSAVMGFGPGQSRIHSGCRAGKGRLFQAREQRARGGSGQ